MNSITVVLLVVLSVCALPVSSYYGELVISTAYDIDLPGGYSNIIQTRSEKASPSHSSSPHLLMYVRREERKVRVYSGGIKEYE